MSKPNTPNLVKAESPPLARYSLGLLVGLTALVFLTGLLIVGAVAFSVHGSVGLGICALVWSLVVVSAFAAYLVGSLFSSAEMIQSQLIIGIAIRTGIPLVFTLFVVQFAKTWLDYGCVYYLFAFYFLGLAVDVFLMAATFRPEPVKALEKSAIDSSAADVSR